MAQRIVKDCFGSDELPSDKAIFRYEMELLQCIQFNINLIQNPVPVSSFFSSSLLLRFAN